MEIITGYTGEAHVTSLQDSIRNSIAMSSKGKYVIPNLANGLSSEISSAYTIRINSGYCINQGRLMGISVGDYEEFPITPPTEGTKRVDLIVARYERDNQTGIESAKLVRVEGTPSSDYYDPGTYDNDLLDDNSMVDDLILCRIKLNGTIISSVEDVADRWYLDTGWRGDLVDIISPSTSSPSVGLRIIGNRVFLRCRGSVTSRLELNIPEEYVPHYSAYEVMQSYPYDINNDIGIMYVEYDGDNENYNVLIRPAGDYSGTLPIIVDTSWFIN